MTCSPKSFALLPTALGKLVDADDVPISSQSWNPLKIRRIAPELIGEVKYLSDIRFADAKLPDRVSQIRWEIGVKEKLHAASRCSKATAAFTA